MIGRIALTLSVLSLLCACFIQLFGFSFFGMSQEHMFNDAMALGIIAVGFLLDAMIHKKEEGMKIV